MACRMHLPVTMWLAIQVSDRTPDANPLHMRHDKAHIKKREAVFYLKVFLMGRFFPCFLFVSLCISSRLFISRSERKNKTECRTTYIYTIQIYQGGKKKNI